MQSQAKNSPAAERNREPIRQVLAEKLGNARHVLEVSSGTGQHAEYFSAALPSLVWQPSDRDESSLQSIAAWREQSSSGNFLAPVYLDVTEKTSWPAQTYDAVFCANMIHIAPWEATLGLFALAEQVLPVSGKLLLYGPFRRNGGHTAPSNQEFEKWLHAQDERFGVRDLEKVSEVAQTVGFELGDVIVMPANNFIVLFAKTKG